MLRRAFVLYAIRSPWCGLLLLTLLSVATFWMNNSVLPIDLMESRNLATAYEMVVSGNYLVPTLNGELRLEKPPLPTWAAAMVEVFIPDSLIAQRSLSAFMAWLWMMFVFLIGKELTGSFRKALALGVVLVSSYAVMFMARNATWDIWCHALMTGAVYFYLLATLRDGKQWWNFSLVALFFALSFLSKGPVAFYSLLLPFLLSYHWVYHPAMKGKILPLIWMLLLTLLIGSWWYIYLYLFEYDRVVYVISKETAAWSGRNVRPWWYYFLFFTESGIWGLFWLSALFSTFLYPLLRKKRLLFFGVCWTLVALFLLSGIPEKKNRYLLPMMVPCAITVGAYLIHLWETCLVVSKERLLLKVNVWIIGIVGLLISCLFVYQGLVLKNMPVGPVVIIVFLLVCLSVWMIYEWAKISTVFVGYALFMGIVGGLGIPLIQPLFVHTSLQSIHVLSQQPELNKYPIYYPVQEEVRAEIVYFARSSLLPLDCTDSLAIAAKLPFLLVTSVCADSFRMAVSDSVLIHYIGGFDDNWRPPSSKRYNKKLRKDVWLLSGKQDKPSY